MTTVTAEKPMILYSYLRCPFAMRVRIVLQEKEILHTIKEEDLKSFSPEIRRLHPKTAVPVLVHGELVLHESSIITEYLDDAFPKTPLMPKDADKRAIVRLWTLWCNQTFKPHIDHFKYKEFRSNPEDVWLAGERLHEDLKKLDMALSQSEYLIGNACTLADIHVFPFLRQLLRVTPPLNDLDKFTHVQRWFKQFSERPSYLKSMEKN